MAADAAAARETRGHSRACCCGMPMRQSSEVHSGWALRSAAAEAHAEGVRSRPCSLEWLVHAAPVAARSAALMGEALGRLHFVGSAETIDLYMTPARQSLLISSHLVLFFWRRATSSSHA